MADKDIDNQQSDGFSEGVGSSDPLMRLREIVRGLEIDKDLSDALTAWLDAATVQRETLANSLEESQQYGEQILHLHKYPDQYIHSVALSRPARSGVKCEVKVYGKTADEAYDGAVRIFEKLVAAYPARTKAAP